VLGEGDDPHAAARASVGRVLGLERAIARALDGIDRARDW